MKRINEVLNDAVEVIFGLIGIIFACLISASYMVFTGALIIGVICLPFVGLFYLCKFLLG